MRSDRPWAPPAGWPSLAAWIASVALAILLGLASPILGWIVGVGATLVYLRTLFNEYDQLRLKVLELVREEEQFSTSGTPSQVVDRVRTRLERAVAVLQSERDDLMAILESTGEGILVLGQHQRVELVNGAACRLLGLPVDALGRSLPALLDAREITAYAAALLRGDSLEALRVSLGKGQQAVQLSLSGNLVPAADLRRRAVLVLHDLTPRQHLERVRTDFVANVTHEMRSPLASILGYAETLADELSGGDALAEDCVERILRNARRMDAIIRDLIRLSRLEHATAPKLIETDVRKLVDEVAADVRDRSEDKLQKLELDVEGLPRSLSVDPDLLRQALINLVDNAVKYTPEEGTVRIRGRVGETGTGSELRLAVENTGPGIPHEHHGRIFERFYRVDTARSRAVGGTGLGLAIVKHCAAVHGGTVLLESEQGALTSFELVLPVVESGDGGAEGSVGFRAARENDSS